MLTRISTKQLSVDGKPDTTVSSISGDLNYKNVTARYLKIVSATYNAAKAILTLTFNNGNSVSVSGFIRTSDLHKGQRGAPGRKGKDGADGFNGRDGEQGNAGSTGRQGFIGDTGVQGERGYAGNKGEKGYKGERGDRGDSGSTGLGGLTGGEGKPGEAGKDERFFIKVSESDPGALGPGAFWVKPSKFKYNQDKVSFTLVSSENKQHLYELQELYELHAYGNDLPGAWFSQSRDLVVNEYAFTDSKLLANFWDEAVFCVFSNSSSFGDVSHVVKTDGSIVELGPSGNTLVSNAENKLVAILIDNLCYLYNTQYEYVQEQILLPDDCFPVHSIALYNQTLLLASQDGIYQYYFEQKHLDIVSDGTVDRLLVDDKVYGIGSKCYELSESGITEIEKFDFCFHSIKYMYENKELSFGDRTIKNVDKVVISDDVYFSKASTLYVITADGYQFITNLNLDWYTDKNTLVEYDEHAFFMEKQNV